MLSGMKMFALVEWHKNFKGREDIKDDGRSGHPKTQRKGENVEVMTTNEIWQMAKYTDFCSRLEFRYGNSRKDFNRKCMFRWLQKF